MMQAVHAQAYPSLPVMQSRAVLGRRLLEPEGKRSLLKASLKVAHYQEPAQARVTIMDWLCQPRPRLVLTLLSHCLMTDEVGYN